MCLCMRTCIFLLLSQTGYSPIVSCAANDDTAKCIQILLAKLAPNLSKVLENGTVNDKDATPSDACAAPAADAPEAPEAESVDM